MKKINMSKKGKRYLAILTAVGVIVSAGAVFAASPAEIISKLTGKTSEELAEMRASGKTYGTIAKEAGKLEEFKAEMTVEKKAILEQRVKDGKLTQEKANEIVKALEENQASCDGTATGSAKIGQKLGAGFGMGSGSGLGQEQGRGQKQGNGLRDGSGAGKGSSGQGRGQGMGRNR
jgi:hypothetical protein